MSPNRPKINTSSISIINAAAIKSFYGIKTVDIKSSVLWRQNNRDIIFWFSFIATLALSITVFVNYDSYLTEILASKVGSAQLGARFFTCDSFVSPNQTSYINTDELVMNVHQQHIDDESYEELDQREQNTLGQDLAMVELDARSIADSTIGLLNDC
jgi:hypothetical protein